MVMSNYRIYPCISPGPIQGHKDFWWAYTQGGGLIHKDKQLVSFVKAYANSMGNLHSKSMTFSVFLHVLHVLKNS